VDLLQLDLQLLELGVGRAERPRARWPHIVAERLSQVAVPNIGLRQNVALLVEGPDGLSES
jgi:hypothetical protein